MNSSAFLKGVDEADRKMRKFTGSYRRLGRKLESIGTRMSLGLTVPIAAFGATSLKAAGDFEAAMNNVGAVSGATALEMQALRDTAKELGATTQFSASQSAEALGFLSMAGFNANQSIAALPGTLQLAAAANMDLGASADIVSNVLSGYGFKVEELSRVNDVLVKTFTSANTDLRQLGEAMKYAGPVAAAAGVEFEESAAAIGLMGNAGIQSSMAGTSLRGSISRLLEPTAKAATAMREIGFSALDSEGRLLELDQIIQQLEPHAEDAGLFMNIFGQRAGPAMAALVSQGSDALRSLEAELKNSAGTAASIASAQMEGFNGAMKRLASAFEGLQIAIGDSGFLEFATGMADSLAGLLGRISELDPVLLNMGVVAAGAAAAIGPLALALGAASTAFAAGLPIIVAMGPPLAGIAAAATAASYAWGPLKAAMGFVHENALLLTPAIGALTVKALGPMTLATIKAGWATLKLAAAKGKSLLLALGASLKSITLQTTGLFSMGRASGAATAATIRLSGALKLLRKALITTGIGALVVGAGYLIERFVDLVQKTGGIREAIALLRSNAESVFRQMGLMARGFGNQLKGVFLGIAADGAAAFNVLLANTTYVVDRMIGLHVGAFKGIIAAGQALPAAFKAFGGKAVNALVEMVENALGGITSAFSELTEFVGLGTIPAPDLSVWRFEIAEAGNEAVSMAGNARDAFTEAFNASYTSGLSDSLGDVVTGLRNSASEAKQLGRAQRTAASGMLSATRDMIAEQERLGRGAQETNDTIQDASLSVEELNDALSEAGQAGASALGGEDGVAGGAGRAASALEKTKEEASQLEKSLQQMSKGFFDTLLSGDIKGAFRGIFSELENIAKDSFASMASNWAQNLLKMSKAPSGGGAGGIANLFSVGDGGGFGGLGSLFGGAGAAGGGGLAGLFGGAGGAAGLAGMAGMAAQAVPYVGAAITAFNVAKSVFKGFSSKKLIGAGIELGVEDGEIEGNSFRRVQKSSWWGARKKKRTYRTAFDSEVEASLSAQLGAMQESVTASFETIGLSVNDGIIDGVDLAVRRIDTRGLSQEEIDAKIAEVFTDYGDALSEAIGGIDLETAEMLAQVQASLDPIGGRFELASFEASAGLASMADAAASLAEEAGGVENLAALTSSFYQNFYSEAEQLNRLEGQVGDVFDELGLALPATDAAFRELLEAQDLLTLSGREAYASLLRIAPAFDEITDAAEEAAEAEAGRIAELEAARIEALEQERQVVADLLSSRDDTLFNLLGEDAQIEALRAELQRALGGLKLEPPETLAGYADLIAAQDTSTEAGRATLETLLDLTDEFRRVIEFDAEASQALAEAQQARLEARDALLFDFSSEEAQLASYQEQVANAFSGLGLNIPETRAAFAEALQGLDLNSAFGAEAFDLLSGVAPAFEEVLKAADAQKQAAEEAAEAQRKAAEEMAERLNATFSLDVNQYRSEADARAAAIAEARGYALRQNVYQGDGVRSLGGVEMLESLGDMGRTLRNMESLLRWFRHEDIERAFP